jgi:16S rRNA (guanine966-N2)-methyltransferase
MRIIAGRWRGHPLKAPPGDRTRPTADRVREAWMSALHFELPGSRVLDLFAGSGALGLEALSRGAGEVTFVERAMPALEVLRENVGKLGATQNVHIVRADVFSFLDRLVQAETGPPFDIVLADPPYGAGLAADLLRRFDEAPFGTSLWVEHGRTEPMPALPRIRTRLYGDTAITTTWVSE